ncbi:zinc finger homeobox protein 3 isoform X1 [Palaemon carinicauda]|uniref:zinc finger homeobox protein 3 isoform X1 n=1 Tax=Palaemon carinicauda TaxID=392227 RepID=UPI0035B61C91
MMRVKNIARKHVILEETKEEGRSPDQVHACPFCHFTCDTESGLQHHVDADHGGEKKAGLRCPLCEEACPDMNALEKHAINVHSVNADGLQRLLLLVKLSAAASKDEEDEDHNSQQHHQQQHHQQQSDHHSTPQEHHSQRHVKTEDNQSSGAGKRSEERNVGREPEECGVCGVACGSVEDLLAHQTAMGHLPVTETPRGPGYLCWKKGCNQYFPTAQALHSHFREIHGAAPRPSVAVSERHVYKYRCQQCSLAFKTVEKLQLHAQYHAIRDATKCLLCHRNFRSLGALQKHVSTDHPELTTEEKHQFQASIFGAPVGAGAGPVLDPNTTALLRRESNKDDEIEEIPRIEEPPLPPHQQAIEDYLNSDTMALDNYSDPARRYKCHRCRVAFTRQSYLTVHQKTLLHRRGEKLTYPMEKYLDPNRPYKCDVCKESFTQKNILLVHYNSVSHLHKLKKAMQDKEFKGSSSSSNIQSEAGILEGGNMPLGESQSGHPGISGSGLGDEEGNKPYRCHVCRVAYSQQSTLDIHLRSVLHQSRTARLPDYLPTASHDPRTLVDHSPIPTSTPQPSPAQSHEPNNTHSPSTPQVTPTTRHVSPSRSTSAQGSCGRCGGVWSTAEQGAQHAVLCGLLPPQLNVLPHSVSNASVALDTAWVALCQASAANLPQTPAHDRSLSPSECSIESLSTSRFTVPFRKSSRLHKHLLESFGFDLVVQYVESQQPYQSKSLDDGNCEDSKYKSNPNLPELSKSKCPQCSKKFSSVWVLKAHLEEIHKSCVPFDYLKKFSDEYRKEYNTSRHSSSSEPSALTDDERGRDAEIVQGGEKGTSDEREKEAESGSRSDAAATPTSHTTPTPGVTPTSTTAPSVSPAADQGMNVPPQMAEMAAALNALTAAQMQQMQFNPMMMAGLGLAGLPLQLNPLAAMNLHPPLMPMLPPHMFDHVALSNMQQQSSPTSGPSGLQGDPCMFLKQQQQLMQQQQQHAAAAAAAAAAQQKRARTRITDEQLKILRAHFDINNSPTEDQINDMAKQSGLPPKVIKHWFRNTLFKERQRSKDSPYNFSIPPSTTLNLEEYEKTGEAKVMPLNPDEAREIVALNSTREEDKSIDHISKEQEESNLDCASVVSPLNKVPSFTQDNSRVQEKNGDSVGGSLGPSSQQHLFQHQRDHQREQQLREQREQLNPQPLLPPHPSQPSSQVGGGSQLVSSASSSPLGLPATPSFTSLASPQTSLSLTSLITSQLETNPMLAHKLPHTPPTVPSSGLIPPSSGVSPTPPHLSFPSAPQTPTSSSSITGKRANRTRFTDYQIKVLQEFFENNAYPKDDDLEYLSKLLNLSPRVIVVWFQNARQKARKVYENQPPLDPNDEGAGRFTRTPGLNYQCKKCLLVFQRYYELIRHQKTHCFKEEDAKRSAQAQAAAAQAAALYNDENSNHSSITESSQQSGSLDNKSTTETYQCDKCSLVFNRFEQWREHQIVHLMNPALFLNKGADSPFTSIQQQQQQSQPPPQHQLPLAIPPPQPSPLLPPASPLKRKTDESEDERDLVLGSSEGQRDKRLRTTILPEQLDYLYQKYQLEANPSRKMLETIAQEVGLKKRVVQVWFQNTRARERKGQFRAHAQVINKKCPFCPAIFKVKSALESHLSTKHADQYSKGDVDIDALPDVEDSGVGNFSLSSTPSSTQASQVMPSSFFSSPEVPEDSIAMYHEEAIRRYLNDVNLASDGARREGESPLDLSKPLEMVRPLGFDSSFLDTSDHLGDHSDDECYHLDVGEPEDGDLSLTIIESNPTSPASSTTSSARPGGPHSASKRFRTQMSAIQVKIMKSVFHDYKTPTMAECELLGREIGLAKRVVQVWFQNARAKEKKAKLALQKMLGTEPEGPKPPEECKVCNFKYSHKYSVQDHLFTRSHIENMKMFLEKVKEESEVAGLTSSLSSLSADSDKQPSSLTPAAGLAHQLQMAQLMALGSPPATVGITASDDRKVGPGGSNNNDDVSRLQLLQQVYHQMGLGGLQGAPHPLLQHAMMAGAGE